MHDLKTINWANKVASLFGGGFSSATCRLSDGFQLGGFLCDVALQLLYIFLQINRLIIKSTNVQQFVMMCFCMMLPQTRFVLVLPVLPTNFQGKLLQAGLFVAKSC